jgi:hypothetical protein
MEPAWAFVWHVQAGTFRMSKKRQKPLKRMKNLMEVQRREKLWPRLILKSLPIEPDEQREREFSR